MSGKDKLHFAGFVEVEIRSLMGWKEKEVWRGMTDDVPKETVFIEFDLVNQTVFTFRATKGKDIEHVALTWTDMDAIHARMQDLGWGAR